jgi:tripartite-type tricarboxylate transporter receptor subunit TctC
MKMDLKRRQMLAIALSLPTIAVAQTPSSPGWPSRPIKLIVPFPPGGQTDAAARIFAQKLEPILGQPVIIDNRPGASTVIGTDFVAKSPPDGYTLLLNMTALVTNPILLPNITYDPFRDFAPVARLYQITGIWAVPASGPKTLAEFIQQAKAAPNPLSFGTTGHASSSHYFGEVLARSGGIKLNHVPYKGEAPIVPDLVAGRLDAGVISGQTALAHGKEGGGIRVLATTGAARLKSLPNLPTFEEQGVGGLALESFCGIFAPAGTPPAIVERLADAFNKVMLLPEVQQGMATLGVEPPSPGTPAQFAAVMRKAQGEWVEIKKKSEIRLE